jgi:hypothetical protein
MSFYDVEKDYLFLLTPREVSFINKNIRKDNNLVKKLRATKVYDYGKEIPVEDEYVPLHYKHPLYPFYSHINDIYCFKVYSAIDIMKYNKDNHTNFNYKTGHERPLRTTTYQKPYYPKYDDDGNKIELIKELGKHLQPVNNVKYKTVLV